MSRKNKRNVYLVVFTFQGRERAFRITASSPEQAAAHKRTEGEITSVTKLKGVFAGP